MTEPLLGHRAYVVEWDDFTGGVALRSNTPGPAGSLVVEFDGLTLALDAANPRLVNFIEVGDGQAATDPSLMPSLMRRLIGDAATDEVAALVTSGSSRPRRIDATDGAREQPVPARIARLATALAGAEAPGLLPEEAALATLEAVAIARNAGLLDDLPSSQERLQQAASEVAALTEPKLARLDRTSRVAAADACELAAAWVPDRLGDDLRRVASQLRTNRPQSGLATTPSRPPASPAELAVAISLDSLPLMTAERLPSVTRTSNDEYEVRLHGWAERATGWWVRAFRVDGQVPLAAVPMLDEGPDAVAQLLLAQSDGGDFELDIVGDPGSVRPSRQLAAFRAAIASGQRAARLERLDRRDAAAHAWQRSSELHRRAGDEDRARQAEAIASNQRAASQRFASPHVGATFADHCLPTS